MGIFGSPNSRQDFWQLKNIMRVLSRNWLPSIGSGTPQRRSTSAAHAIRYTDPAGSVRAVHTAAYHIGGQTHPGFMSQVDCAEQITLTGAARVRRR